MSPTTAFHLLQGVETLGPRMDRHVANTQAVAAFLAQSEAVAWVSYPGLKVTPTMLWLKARCQKAAGAVIAFGIKGSRRRAGNLSSG